MISEVIKVYLSIIAIILALVVTLVATKPLQTTTILALLISIIVVKASAIKLYWLKFKRWQLIDWLNTPERLRKNLQEVEEKIAQLEQKMRRNHEDDRKI